MLGISWRIAYERDKSVTMGISVYVCVCVLTLANGASGRRTPTALLECCSYVQHLYSGCVIMNR